MTSDHLERYNALMTNVKNVKKGQFAVNLLRKIAFKVAFSTRKTRYLLIIFALFSLVTQL
jgi:hypothetical protein